MRKSVLFLVGLLCILFTSCNWNSKKDNGAHGSVTVSLNTDARTITPVDWKISDCKDWTITFEGVGDKIEFTSNKLYASETYTIPTGNYVVSVLGKVPASGEKQGYYLTGKSSEVTVAANDNTGVSIYLSLKKTDEGKGSFEYSILFKDEEFQDRFEDTTFSAYLTRVESNQEVPLSVQKITSGDYPKLRVYSESALSSGYYYLTVKYVLDFTSYLSLEDSLVEIADGLKTSREWESNESQRSKNKTFYADNKSEHSDRNGLIPQYKREFNSIIKWLSDNKSEWQNADIYFYDDTVYMEGDFMSMLNQTPLYNADVNPTENGDNRRIQVYAGVYQKPLYAFVDGKIVLESGYSDVNVLYFSSEAVTSPVITVENNGFSFDQYTYFRLFLDNTKIKLTNMDGLNEVTTPTIGVYSTNLAPYVNSESKPLLSLNYNSEGNFANFSASKISYVNFEQSAEGDITYKGQKYNQSSEKYTMFAKKDSGNKKMDFFTALAGTSEIDLNPYFPTYVISGKVNAVYHIDSTEFTYALTPTIEGTSFSEGTTYKWFLNGTLLSETGASVTINPTTNTNLLAGKNTLMSLVSYDGQYSSKSIDINIKYVPTANTGVLVYNKDGKLNVFADENVPEATLGDSDLSSAGDFTFDAYGNLYVAKQTTTTTDTASYDSSKNATADNPLYNIYKYPVKDDGTVDINSGKLIFTTMCNSALLSCDMENNVLYIMDSDNINDGYKNIHVFKIDEPQTLLEKVGPTSITSDTTVSARVYDYKSSTSSPRFPTMFAVSNNMVYYYDDSDYIKREMLIEEENKYVLKYYGKLCGIDSFLTSNVREDVSPYTALNDYSSEVTDMIISGEYLYVLISNNGGSNKTSPVYQRGAVVKIMLKDDFDPSITDKDYLAMYNWGDSSSYLLGWNSTDLPAEGGEDGGTGTFTIYQGSDTAADGTVDYLVGPQKFVAVKPKKVMFIDGGWIVSDNGSASGTRKMATLKKIKRVVTLDLEAETMKGTDLENIIVADYASTSSGFTY